MMILFDAENRIVNTECLELAELLVSHVFIDTSSIMSS